MLSPTKKRVGGGKTKTPPKTLVKTSVSKLDTAPPVGRKRREKGVTESDGEEAEETPTAPPAEKKKKAKGKEEQWDTMTIEQKTQVMGWAIREVLEEGDHVQDEGAAYNAAIDKAKTLVKKQGPAQAADGAMARNLGYEYAKQKARNTANGVKERDMRDRCVADAARKAPKRVRDPSVSPLSSDDEEGGAGGGARKRGRGMTSGAIAEMVAHMAAQAAGEAGRDVAVRLDSAGNVSLVKKTLVAALMPLDMEEPQVKALEGCAGDVAAMTKLVYSNAYLQAGGLADASKVVKRNYSGGMQNLGHVLKLKNVLEEMRTTAENAPEEVRAWMADVWGEECIARTLKLVVGVLGLVRGKLAVEAIAAKHNWDVAESFALEYADSETVTPAANKVLQKLVKEHKLQGPTGSKRMRGVSAGFQRKAREERANERQGKEAAPTSWRQGYGKKCYKCGGDHFARDNKCPHDKSLWKP